MGISLDLVCWIFSLSSHSWFTVTFFFTVLRALTGCRLFGYWSCRITNQTQSFHPQIDAKPFAHGHNTPSTRRFSRTCCLRAKKGNVSTHPKLQLQSFSMFDFSKVPYIPSKLHFRVRISQRSIGPALKRCWLSWKMFGKLQILTSKFLERRKVAWRR